MTSLLVEADLKFIMSPRASSRGVLNVEVPEYWPEGLVTPYDMFATPLTTTLTTLAAVGALPLVVAARLIRRTLPAANMG